MEKKFKVGDKVRIINDCKNMGVCEVDGGKGMVGVVAKVHDILNQYKVESNEFVCSRAVNGSLVWWVWGYALELVEETVDKWGFTISSNQKCPRCGNEMSKKSTQEYGLIDKCQSCGYC